MPANAPVGAAAWDSRSTCRHGAFMATRTLSAIAGAARSYKGTLCG